jgi:3-demethoxyubiquinol 3-hydroxylase
LNRTSSAPLLKEMLDQETVHRDTFNRIIGANNIRPTFFTPLWHVAGFSLGAVTALMGKETAMLCTEAVETEIGRHYNDQLRKLIEIVNEMVCDVNQGNHSEGKEELEILKEVIKTFRDEELEHLDHAVENDSRSAPLHGLLTSVIQTGCKVAIKISERI